MIASDGEVTKELFTIGGGGGWCTLYVSVRLWLVSFYEVVGGEIILAIEAEEEGVCLTED